MARKDPHPHNTSTMNQIIRNRLIQLPLIDTHLTFQAVTSLKQLSISAYTFTTLLALAPLTIVLVYWAVVILPGVLLHVGATRLHRQITPAPSAEDSRLGEVHAGLVPEIQGYEQTTSILCHLTGLQQPFTSMLH